MTDTSLPKKFAHLEEYVEEWSIRDEAGRYLKRHNSTLEELTSYFNTIEPLLLFDPNKRPRQGRTRTVMCAFHGWTFALEGKCLKISDEGKFYDLNKNDISMMKIHTDTWKGQIFVTTSISPTTSGLLVPVRPIGSVTFIYPGRTRRVTLLPGKERSVCYGMPSMKIFRRMRRPKCQ